MALPPGSRVGPYEVVGPIGAGGMGEVYRAHDSKLDRPVAIKSFRHSTPTTPIVSRGSNVKRGRWLR